MCGKWRIQSLISKHHRPSNKDSISLVDAVRVIEIPPCRFYHNLKVHPIAFITTVSVPIVGTALALVPAPLRCRMQGTAQTVAWQLGHTDAKRFLLIPTWATSLECISVVLDLETKCSAMQLIQNKMKWIPVDCQFNWYFSNWNSGINRLPVRINR